MDAQELLAAGYKTYKDHWEKSLAFYQKRVDDPNNPITRYFINVYQYDMSQYTPNKPMWFEVRMQWETTFVDCLHFQFDATKMSVSEMENAVARMYNYLYAVPYEVRG